MGCSITKSRSDMKESVDFKSDRTNKNADLNSQRSQKNQLPTQETTYQITRNPIVQRRVSSRAPY
ncbi:hypothetical protein pb186bvf_010499 [Paramecium bursaria]